MADKLEDGMHRYAVIETYLLVDRGTTFMVEYGQLLEGPRIGEKIRIMYPLTGITGTVELK